MLRDPNPLTRSFVLQARSSPLPRGERARAAIVCPWHVMRYSEYEHALQRTALTPAGAGLH